MFIAFYKKKYIYHSYETFIQTFIPPFILLSFIRSESSEATVICKVVHFLMVVLPALQTQIPSFLARSPWWWWRWRRSRWRRGRWWRSWWRWWGCRCSSPWRHWGCRRRWWRGQRQYDRYGITGCVSTARFTAINVWTPLVVGKTLLVAFFKKNCLYTTL